MPAEQEPLTLSVNVKDRDEIYSVIAKTSILKGQTKEIFLLAAAMGYKAGERLPLKGKRVSYVRMEYLKEEEPALLNSIAIMEKKNLDIIADKKEVSKIVEEYANAGIKILREMVFDQESGSFVKQFESYLRDNFPKIKKKKTDDDVE